ncbi:chemotaxis protein CheB [bacterium]|nr:chemotaxis protein CheB [bacterium]
MTSNDSLTKIIKVLIVDDSWVLRRVLRGTFSRRSDVKIVGEATNGVEALEMVLNLKPDVIMLDMEMPIMDGMTTLQHLMIHTPIPTIILSSLSEKGTPRCFDALKYGAVDFVYKNSFFQGIDGAEHSKRVLGKVFAAAKTSVYSIDPIQNGIDVKSFNKVQEKVIFCEDCGARQDVSSWALNQMTIQCANCGDEISLHENKTFRRMNFFSIIGAGASGYANLLKIIPALNPEMGGAICIVINDDYKRVQSFVKYLDAICGFEVILGRDGITIEGGYCYVFSATEKIILSPYSGNYRFKTDLKKETGSVGSIDTLMSSAVACLGNRVSGVLLSGSESDGSKGFEEIIEAKGSCYVLNPQHCFHKTMTTKALERYDLLGDLDEMALAVRIQQSHFENKENVKTA